MNLDLDDIQGNVLVGYRFPLVAHLFGDVDVNDPTRCRKFLQSLRATAASRSDIPLYSVNVGLTYPALGALAGDRNGKIRSAFPAFSAGMRSRARLLRDPEIATWANRHLWIAIHAKSDKALTEGIGAVLQMGYPFETVLRGAAIVGDDNHWYEHFGFRDDIASPVIEGTEAVREPRNLAGNGKRDASGQWVPLKAGEFVLGYPNESNETPPGDELMDLFRNGTFAVFRDLEQDVDAFRSYTLEQAKRAGLDADDLAAKIIGRNRDGSALVETKSQPNDFDYSRDPAGTMCPLGAHIRRANHRDPDEKDRGRHRLIRRGRSYAKSAAGNGAASVTTRGLYFVGINASIEDQFEFIHRRWLNDRASTDGDLDPLIGVGENRTFVIEGQTPPLVLVDIPNFVTFRGGEYYFMPGLRVLDRLARGPMYTSSNGGRS